MAPPSDSTLIDTRYYTSDDNRALLRVINGGELVKYLGPDGKWVPRDDGIARATYVSLVLQAEGVEVFGEEADLIASVLATRTAQDAVS